MAVITNPYTLNMFLRLFGLLFEVHKWFKSMRKEVEENNVNWTNFCGISMYIIPLFHPN